MANAAAIPIIDDNEELEELKILRRIFHQNPELGWTEFWTTVTIAARLEKMGYEIVLGRELYDDRLATLRRELPGRETLDTAYDLAREMVGETKHLRKMKGGFTGLVAHIKGRAEEGGGAGPRIGFRFDIDGLPIRESTGQDHVPTTEGFSSKNSNMHACAHDGHITIGLGLAKRIQDNINSLGGDYYLAFQPAEEGGRGGLVFSQIDEMKALDYFVAIHLGFINQRKLVCGISFLSSRKFEVVFRGISSHASASPHEGRNALLGACVAVVNLYGITRHGEGATRINIGEFHSHNSKNVISDHVAFKVDVRGETNDICDYMTERAMKILKSAAEMHDVDLEIRELGHSINVPSSPLLKEKIRGAALEAGIPEDAILDSYSAMGSEDAPHIMKEVEKNGGQAAYVCVGSPSYGSHHNPAFDFDEDLMLWGVRVLWGLVEELSGG